MDIETVTETATDAIEEYPSTTKTVLITVAATAVTMIGARLVLRRHFAKATEQVPTDIVDQPTETPEVVNV